MGRFAAGPSGRAGPQCIHKTPRPQCNLLKTPSVESRNRYLARRHFWRLPVPRPARGGGISSPSRGNEAPAPGATLLSFRHRPGRGRARQAAVRRVPVGCPGRCRKGYPLRSLPQEPGFASPGHAPAPVRRAPAPRATDSSGYPFCGPGTPYRRGLRISRPGAGAAAKI